MKQLSLIIATAFMVSMLTLGQATAKRIYVDVNNPNVRKISLAIPWFENSGLAGARQQYGRNLAATLAKALEFHGIIEVTSNQPRIGAETDWKGLGVDYGVIGRYAISNDQISMEIRLFNGSDNTMQMGKSYNGPTDKTDQMMYRFADSIIEEFTGKPGIASTQIAFVSQPADKREKEVFITDILGKKLRQVTRHHSLIVSPRFSPDGNLLAYTSYHSGNQNLYVTDLRQSISTRVLSRRNGMNLAPAWAPDGQRLIVTLSHLGNPDLFTLDRQGEIVTQLTKNAGINVSPTFSPDGNHIVFVSDRSGKPQLYLMELASGNTQRITFEGRENAEPSWSPTENLVVYSSLRDGIYQLCTINPFQDNSAEQITSDQTYHESPAWSPDGNQIIFAKRDGSGHKIYGIMKNGSYQRMLFSLPGSQTYPRWSVKTY